MVNHFNSELLSPQDISRVFSAPSSRTQLIPWSANCIVKVNQKVQSDLKWQEFTNKLDLKDFGVVWPQEFWWSVPLQVFNGGFTIHSRPQWASPPQEEEQPKKHKPKRIDVPVSYISLKYNLIYPNKWNTTAHNNN